MVLLGGQRARQALWGARDILVAEQIGELSEFLGLGKMLEDAAEKEDAHDIGGGSEGWVL